jgi:prophage antirepressor
MNELVTRIGKEPKETITSLELLELINKFRIEDGNKTKIEHKDLLKAIRNEFRKQIGEGKISPTSYKDNWNRNQPKFDLTLKQSLRLLTKESIEVREKVFDYIENLEKQNQ